MSNELIVFSLLGGLKERFFYYIRVLFEKMNIIKLKSIIKIWTAHHRLPSNLPPRNRRMVLNKWSSTLMRSSLKCSSMTLRTIRNSYKSREESQLQKSSSKSSFKLTVMMIMMPISNQSLRRIKRVKIFVIVKSTTGHISSRRISRLKT